MNLNNIVEIKAQSSRIWQHLAAVLGCKYDTRKNVKAWFRSDKNPSVHFYTNKATGEVFYHDFAGDTVDVITAWAITYNLNNSDAIKQLIAFLGIEQGGFVPSKVQYTPPPPPQIITLDRSEMAASCNPLHLKTNNFYIWLISLFGIDDATTAAKMYNVGTSNNSGVGYGAAAFWYVDALFEVRYCSVIPYDSATGKRVRDAYPTPIAQPKAHKNKGLTKCYFGEHLILMHPQKTVCIVESEKTAIVCSIVMPQFVWIASGGAAGVTTDKSECLRGKTVVVVPDFDTAGRSLFEGAISKLAGAGAKATICDLFPNRNDKTDICDYVVQQVTQSIDAPVPTPAPTASPQMPFAISPAMQAFLTKHDFYIHEITTTK